MDIYEIMKKHKVGKAKFLPQAQSHDEYLAQFNASVNAVIEEFRAKHGNNKTAEIEVVIDEEINSLIVRAKNY